ncbi:SnoaL-like protein [Ulvibacter sp. MAR_2010_11]|uniref:nuclear transport factor 2 family protein n=1 Tax=Ulvibacter sp. MAR_2010_11 TaxID=1250229 RepID=UPI000C2C71B9|nr:nuclear transport factor 2 family protein [Ulvibacter sp. MAR_2010_11]PKA81990.1 SnoaL-like protein [Ulvibacter sp. MAR_2010_11]
MDLNKVVKQWFKKWEKGDYLNLPISANFTHISPFGTINGKKTYLDLVKENEDKFIGQYFEIHDAIYESNRACVRYTANQGKDFSLDVSEWYYVKNNLIEKIVAYYHIGDIREDRNIENYNN